MVEPTDTLAEACKVAGIVAGEEQEIAAVEKQIADRFREICGKIFTGSHQFRMPTHTVGVHVLDDHVSLAGKQVWQNIGAVLDDRVIWNGDFQGSARTLRITVGGELLAVWQYVPRCREYNLFTGDNYAFPVELYYSQAVRPATDHEIAANAVEIANDLLTVLRTRIDTAKEEKAELRRIAGLGDAE